MKIYNIVIFPKFNEFNSIQEKIYVLAGLTIEIITRDQMWQKKAGLAKSRN